MLASIKIEGPILGRPYDYAPTPITPMQQAGSFVTTRRTPFASFKNPIGLVIRMLLSGKRAAYSALIHEALKIAARPFDAMLAFKDRRLIQNSGASTFPILLVVGAPRSGTTLVYQTLARYLNVSYFSNLTSFFPTAPISGTRNFGWLAPRSAADFENFYGQTAGLLGPNDGFSIWNRWLGDLRYSPRTELSDQEILGMRSFFSAWTAIFQKPLLNKNNRNTSCVYLISQALPNSQFIVVRRDPLFVAQSLIRAREQVQGDKTVGWGLLASETKNASDPLSYVDEVCDQIMRIELELDRQLKEIPADRIVELKYEHFCESPVEVLREISKRLPGVELRESLMATELEPFEVSEKLTLSPEERERVVMRFNVTKSGTFKKIRSHQLSEASPIKVGMLADET